MAEAGSIDAVTEFLVQQKTGQTKPAAETATEPKDEVPAPVTDEEPVVEQEAPTDDLEDETPVVEDDDEEAPKPETDGDDDGDDEEQDAPATEYLDLKDDDLIEVTVDGETEEVTLQDLKNAYGGEGAITKRLEEATLTRKAAQAERDKSVKETEDAKAALVSVVTQLDEVLHTPTVAPPPEALKSSNPGAYVKQLDAYNAEQHALGQSRQKLLETFQLHAEQVEKLKDDQRKTELTLLQQNFEPLRNEKTRQAASKDILDAVKEFGFAPEDMKQVVDHRIYMMAWEAMQWRKLQNAGGEKETQLGELREKVKTKRRRVLRSANNTARRTRNTRKQRENKRIKEQAQKSGKVDDVTAFMVNQRQTQG